MKTLDIQDVLGFIEHTADGDDLLSINILLSELGLVFDNVDITIESVQDEIKYQFIKEHFNDISLEQLETLVKK